MWILSHCDRLASIHANKYCLAEGHIKPSTSQISLTFIRPWQNMSWTHTQQQRLTSHKKTSSHVTAWNSSFVLALASDTMLLTYCKLNGASGKMLVTYRNLDVTSSRNLVTSHLLISPTWLNENSTNIALKCFLTLSPCNYMLQLPSYQNNVPYILHVKCTSIYECEHPDQYSLIPSLLDLLDI